MPSNKFASTLNLTDPDKGGYLQGDKLFSQLTTLFNDAGATAPQSAPNWCQIPKDGDRDVIISFWGNVQQLTPEQLTSGLYVPQNYSSAPYNLTNFAAAPTSIQCQSPDEECPAPTGK